MKGLIFLLGLVVGLLLDVVPGWAMAHWHIEFCAESCQPWLSSVALAAYIATPFALAISAALSFDATARRLRAKPLVLTIAAMICILLITSWMTHAQQVGTI